MTLGSLFDGISGFIEAGARHGIKTLWSSEIDPTCMSISRKHFPDVKQLGDVTKINGAEIEPVDIITAGSPCFPAGTMILTDMGYEPIESIRSGTIVLTHKNRWRKVTATGNRIEETIFLKGNITIETTKEHPIYRSDIKKYYPHLPNHKRGNRKKLVNVGQWTSAKDMKGKQWATPTSIEALSIPVGFQKNINQKPMPTMDTSFWYFVGRWLGDGWVRNEQRIDTPEGQKSGAILLCDSFDKENEIIQTVSKISDNYHVMHEKTGVKVMFTSQILCEWLVANFGKGAFGKTIPSWVLSLPEEYRIAIMLGIEQSDGYRDNECTIRITSISKQLILGIRLLGESLGYTTSLSFCERPKTTTIEGRIVNQKNTYTIALCGSGIRKTGIEKDGHKWYKCRSVLETGMVRQVYNLSVEEDESYIADSIVVHNCQDLSIAGRRDGLEGSRSGLFMEAIRIIKEMRCKTNRLRPTIFFWENVPGAFSSNKGEDFRVVLEEITKINQEGVSIPRSKKWLNAGLILGDGFSVAWRVLSAEYWGVPQRRRRIFLVVDFAGQRAGEILFKPSRKRWCPAQGGTPGEGTAAPAESGVNGVDYLTAWYTQSNRIFTDNGVSPTLSGCDGGGGRNPAGLIAPADVWPETTGSLLARADSSPCIDRGQPFICAGFMGGQGAKAGSIAYQEELSPTLKSAQSGSNTVPSIITYDARGNGDGKTVNTLTGDHQNRVTDYTALAVEPAKDSVAFNITFCDANGRRKDRVDGGLYVNETDKSNTVTAKVSGYETAIIDAIAYENYRHGEFKEGIGTLRASGGIRSGDSGNVVVASSADCRNYSLNEELSSTLQASKSHSLNSINPICAYPLRSFGEYEESDISSTLQSRDYKGATDLIKQSYAVRRLTPMECERLQGFPDGWTEFGHDGKPISDAQRYKALGNSVAIPCVEYVMEGITNALIGE